MYILEVYIAGNYYIYTTHKGYNYFYSFSMSFGFSIPFYPKLASFPPLHHFPIFPYFHLTTISFPYVQIEAKYSIFCSSAPPLPTFPPFSGCLLWQLPATPLIHPFLPFLAGKGIPASPLRHLSWELSIFLWEQPLGTSNAVVTWKSDMLQG